MEMFLTESQEKKEGLISSFLNGFSFKRCFDVAFSMIALILGSPLLIVIALLVIFASRGKLIYGHERVGLGGRKFKCFKFRTMFADADKRLNEILAANPELKEEWDRTHKLKNDPRVTPVGAFLRKTSLDELPQFWNVFLGDLSVVGPRPLVEEEIKKHLGTRAKKILSVKPGLTCFWQTLGRSDLTYADRVDLDEKYIEEASFILDLKLILKTIPCMLLKKGAY